MCITIEPGIYIPHGDERWPRELWGVGMRIEDVVVVGEKKGEAVVLTREAVKEVEDVEALGRRALERKEERRMGVGRYVPGEDEEIDEEDEVEEEKEGKVREKKVNQIL